MVGMLYIAETNGSMRSDLIDLSGVALDELRGVDGLRAALNALQESLSDAPAPLCESTMAAFCESAPQGLPGGRS